MHACVCCMHMHTCICNNHSEISAIIGTDRNFAWTVCVPYVLTLSKKDVQVCAWRCSCSNISNRRATYWWL